MCTRISMYIYHAHCTKATYTYIGTFRFKGLIHFSFWKVALPTYLLYRFYENEVWGELELMGEIIPITQDISIIITSKQGYLVQTGAQNSLLRSAEVRSSSLYQLNQIISRNKRKNNGVRTVTNKKKHINETFSSAFMPLLTAMKDLVSFSPKQPDFKTR